MNYGEIVGVEVSQSLVVLNQSSMVWVHRKTDMKLLLSLQPPQTEFCTTMTCWGSSTVLGFSDSSIHLVSR